MILLLSAFVKVNRSAQREQNVWRKRGRKESPVCEFSGFEGACSALGPGECPGTEFQITTSREGESVTCISIIFVPTRALMLPGTRIECSECATGLDSMILKVSRSLVILVGSQARCAASHTSQLLSQGFFPQTCSC